MKSHRNLPIRAAKPSPPRKDDTTEHSVCDASSPLTTPSVQVPLQVQLNAHSKPKLSNRNPASRSTNSSAPVMRLPPGHKTDHWSWGLPSSTFRDGQPPASQHDEPATDDLFLFPMGSGSLQTPSPFSIMPSSYLEAKREGVSETTTPTFNTNPTSKQSSGFSPPQKRPHVTRSRSYTPVVLGGRLTSHRPVRRAQSITVASMKSARRRLHSETHVRAAEASLRRQVADLTQRVTMLLANQCAACRLGLVECGLGNQRESGVARNEEEWKGEGVGADIGVEKDLEEMGANAPREDRDGTRRGERGRDREREVQIEGQLARLARQARMVAYG